MSPNLIQTDLLQRSLHTFPSPAHGNTRLAEYQPHRGALARVLRHTTLFANRQHMLSTDLNEASSDSDAEIDRETGLTTQSTQRHKSLLAVLALQKDSDPWTFLINWLNQHYPWPATQKSLLSAALGAIKRQTIYHVQHLLPPPTAAVFNRINYLRRAAQKLQCFNLPAAQFSDIRTSLNQLPPVTKLMLLIMVLTGHRGTSVRDLLVNDVLIRRFPPSLFCAVQKHPNYSLVSSVTSANSLVANSTLSLVSLRFRLGKTEKYIGPYTMHIVIPPLYLSILQGLLERPNSTHDRYLFGACRATLLLDISKLVSIRSLRRGVLQFLAWDCGVPLQQLLYMSRHTKVEALYTYLGGGMFCRDEALSTSVNSLLLQNCLLES